MPGFGISVLIHDLPPLETLLQKQFRMGEMSWVDLIQRRLFSKLQNQARVCPSFVSDRFCSGEVQLLPSGDTGGQDRVSCHGALGACLELAGWAISWCQPKLTVVIAYFKILTFVLLRNHKIVVRKLNRTNKKTF